MFQAGLAEMFQEKRGISTATLTSSDKLIFLQDDGLYADQHLAASQLLRKYDVKGARISLQLRASSACTGQWRWPLRW